MWIGVLWVGLGPQKQSVCASFPGKEQAKIGTHMNFFSGGFWV